MDHEQAEKWRAMRTEQDALRTRLEFLEQRLTRFETAQAGLPPSVAPAPVEAIRAPAMPPPLPVARPLVPSAPPVVPVADLPAPTGTAATAEPARRESMEMRIGTDWLVRAGVVFLVTSLAFLADYLYHHVVPRLGPWSKVGLLYLGAGMLAGVGAWLERRPSARAMPKVRTYAGVLLAAGLAAVYYVTYAAHFYPNLRVIDSPLLTGLLLMGWTAFMVWVADRRNSETVATFAILLAYYTSAVNEVAGFTLLSNLPLTAAAVFLMRRHLWKIFPFASLLATFGSYGYWKYFHLYTAWTGAAAPPPTPGYGNFWTEGAFLLVYWLLFTWAVFTASGQVLPTARRAGFVSLNNGAFFLLLTLLVLDREAASFWRWSLGFGVLLLALAEVCRRLPQRTDAPTENAYRFQGVLLVTLGLVTYFTGWQLCLVLAAESAALLAAAARRKGPLLVGASLLTAIGAQALTLQELSEVDTGHFKLLAPAVALIFVFDGWLNERWVADRTGERSTWLASGLFELLALHLGLVWGEHYFPGEANFACFAAAGALVFVLGIETRRWRWVLWSYVLTAAGLAVFWLNDGPVDHRHPFQWLGVACLVLQQQFGHRREGAKALFPSYAQAAVITAAVLTAWVSWSAVASHWQEGGWTLAVSWSVYAVVVFAVGLALRERVYRLLALGVLAGTFGHIAVLDIWHLDSLERFFSLLCLGVVLLAIGFFYTRYQSWLRDIF